MDILRIFGTASNFREAKEKVEMALLTSDLDEEDLRKSRATRKRKFFSDDSEDEFSNSKRSFCQNQDSEEDKSVDKEDEESSKSNMNDKTGKTVDNSHKSNSERENSMTTEERLSYAISIGEETLKKTNKILLELVEIRKRQIDLASELKNNTIPSQGNKASIPSKLLDVSLPVKSIHDFDVLEKTLMKDEKKKEALIEILSRRGGKDYGDLTNNILYRALSDEIACQYSYVGRQKKKCFRETEMNKCIIDAVQSVFPDTKENLLHTKIGSWLAQATVRQTRKEDKKKIEKTKNKDDEKLQEEQEEEEEKEKDPLED